MSDNTFPSSTLFHYPILLVLADGNEHTQKEFVNKIIEVLCISEKDLQETISSGPNKVASWTGFAVRNLRDAGLITSFVKGSGKYVITDKGKLLLSLKPDGFKGGPGKSLMALMKELGIFGDNSTLVLTSNQDHTTNGETIHDKSITVKLSDLASSANATLPDSLLEAVKQMNPKSFEVLIKKLLIAMGYGKTEEDVIVTPYSNDNGIDGYVRKDPLGIEKICSYQAKRYTDTKVGITDMNALGGAMINCGTKCGIFVTTTDFSKQAKNYNPSGYKIIRINGDELVGLLINYGIGVKTEYIEVKTVDKDFLNNL